MRRSSKIFYKFFLINIVSYLRLSSRLNAVGSKIKSAQSMKNVTKELGKTTTSMEKAMKSMNLEKVRASYFSQL